MKMKYILSTLLGLALSLGAFAQTNPGVEYMSLGEHELAKNYFMKAMRQAPVESYFYLGQMALEEGNKAEAKSNFEKGLAANPESALNAVGLAKLNLADSPKDAKKELDEIRKANKKDVTIILEVARAFYENGMEADGLKMVEEARKADKNSPLPYMFQGDMLQKKGEMGQAATRYEQALRQDESNLLAYMKGAQVYMDVNPDAAKEKLEKVQAMNPSYVLANKYMAELSYKVAHKAGSIAKYKEAVTAFEKYFESGQYTISDTKDYAGCLFFLKDYQATLKVAEKGLAQDPKHFVLNRLNMYSKNELEDYQGGLVAAKSFFAAPMPSDTAKYIPQDHTTYANILAKTGNVEEAIKEYDKAVQLDPKNEKVYFEIATACSGARMFEQAGDYYVKYIAAVAASEDETKVVQPTDYFQSANYYQRAAAQAERDTTITVEAVHGLLDKADAELVKLIEMTPDVPLGYRTRAQVNSRKDLESLEGTAKPHYEALIAAVEREAAAEPKPDEAGNITPVPDRTDELKEAYTYLSYYYYLQFVEKNVKDAKGPAVESIQKLLEIDPENKTGAQLKDYFDQIK